MIEQNEGLAKRLPIEIGAHEVRRDGTLDQSRSFQNKMDGNLDASVDLTDGALPIREARMVVANIRLQEIHQPITKGMAQSVVHDRLAEKGRGLFILEKGIVEEPDQFVGFRRYDSFQL